VRILIPISEGRHSLAAVDFVASRQVLVGRDPDVFVLHAQWPIPRPVVRVVGHGQLRQIQDRSAERVFKPALRTLAAAELLTQTISVTGHPGEEIAKAAQKRRVDLIVMASRGLPPARSFFLGSVTNAVLAHSRTPLLIVRSPRAPKRESLLVGIAVDGSRYGAAAVRYVLKHRFLFGPRPEIKLIHVVPEFTPYVADIGGLARIYSDQDIEALQAKAFATAIGPAQALLRKQGMDAEAVRLVGDASRQIAAFARSHGLDVLVMGSHGHGAFTSAILGSVATRVAATCRTPLLLIQRA
jgi:nucleotide-binding universal stress UspA family protein